MSAHPPRRIYLIDRNFQLKYTLLLVLFGGTVMGASGAAVVRELRANTALLEGWPWWVRPASSRRWPISRTRWLPPTARWGSSSPASR